MNLWNTRNLPMPPINTYKAVNTKIDIKHLRDVFEEGRQFFDEDKFMYAEYAVLSRIVYRMKQKFRSAKDFKALEKISKALDNYFKMGISQVLKNFMQLIPPRYKDKTYLPTKNLLDYILVRLQGLVKLMERIVETCKIAAYLLDKRIHTGHFWKVAFITFSIVSRIYILAKYTAKFICEFYSKLIPFSSQLTNTSTWLSDYTFPKDLKEWMNVDWLEIDDDIQIIEIPTEVPDIIQFFDLVDDDEVEFCEEYVMIKDEEDMETKENLKKISKINFKNLWELRGFDTREDVGEVVEINDSLQMLEENSLSQKLFNGRNDTKNILTNTDKHDIIAVSDTSELFEDNIDSDRGDSAFMLQEEKPKMFTEMEKKTIVVTIPDTPLVDRKRSMMQNVRVKKLKEEKNEDELKYDTDIDNKIIEIDDDTVITVSDTSLMEIVDEIVVKNKKKKTKTRPIQKRNINVGNSDALLNRVDAKPMKRKSKKPHHIGGISVKSILELTENTDKGKPTTSFNKNVNDNKITKKKKKNKKNRLKKDHSGNYYKNLVNACKQDVLFNEKINNNVFNSNNELPNKIPHLPSKTKKRKRSPHLNETGGQQSGEPSTSNVGNISKKRKMKTRDDDPANKEVEKIKRALSLNQKSKKRLEANLSKALQKLKKKKPSGKSSGKISSKEKVQTEQGFQQRNKDIKGLTKSDKIVQLKHKAKKQDKIKLQAKKKKNTNNASARNRRKKNKNSASAGKEK